MRKEGYWAVLISTAVLIIAVIGVYLFFGDNEGNGRFKIIENCKEINESGTYILTNDATYNLNKGLDYIYTCFNITADNVLIDGTGHKVLGYLDANDYAFYISNVRNITLQNFSIEHYENGVAAFSVQNLEVLNNKFISDFQGVYLDSVKDARITGNDLSLSGNSAVAVRASDNIIVSENSVSENVYPINLLGNEEIVFDSNSFSKNLYSLVKVTKNSPISYLGKISKFNVTWPYTDCPGCKYIIDLYPKEDSFSVRRVNGTSYGEFIPTRRGIYSVFAELIDTKNNSFVTKSVFLSGTTEKAGEYYYLRGVSPVNLQAESWGIYHQDVGALRGGRPLDNEERSCLDWVSFFPDKLPKYLFGVVTNINFSLDYIYNSTNASIGVQRKGTFDSRLDKSISVANASGKVVHGSFSFNVSWSMNFFWNWYYMSIKLSAIGGNPIVFINSTNPPYATIYYDYSSTPAIESIGDRDVFLLAATMEDNSSSANIILEGTKETSITIQMPDRTKLYYAVYNGINCGDSNCDLTTQSNGEIYLKLNVNGISNLRVIPIEQKQQ